MALCTSQKVFNYIRTKASDEYKNVVPSLSESTPIGVISTPILTSPHVLKEFTELLGAFMYLKVMDASWNNPLAKWFLKQGTPLGSFSAEVGMTLLQPRKYDPLHPERLLFNAYSDEKVVYYVRNIMEYFKLTLIYDDVKGAFSSYESFDDYINEKLASLASSTEFSQFNHMLETIVVNYLAGVMKVSPIKIPRNPANTDVYKNWTKDVLTLSSNMLYPSNNYNNYGNLEGANGDFIGWSRPEDIIIIATTEFIVANNVEFLANAFNISKAEISNRIITVPEISYYKVDYDEKGDPTSKFMDEENKVKSNIACIILDQRFLNCKQDLSIDDSFFNPETLSTNFFKHRWYTMSVNPMANAIVYEYEEENPQLENVTISDFGQTDGENFIDIKTAGGTQTLTLETIPSAINVTSVSVKLNSIVNGNLPITNDNLNEYLTFAVSDGKIVVTGVNGDNLKNNATILVDLTINNTVTITTVAVAYGKEAENV